MNKCEICIYSRAIEQEYPRKCTICGTKEDMTKFKKQPDDTNSTQGRQSLIDALKLVRAHAVVIASSSLYDTSWESDGKDYVEADKIIKIIDKALEENK